MIRLLTLMYRLLPQSSCYVRVYSETGPPRIQLPQWKEVLLYLKNNTLIIITISVRTTDSYKTPYNLCTFNPGYGFYSVI